MARPVSPYIAPVSGDLDQRLAQTGVDLSLRVIALESRVSVLEDHVSRLAARDMNSAVNTYPGAQPGTASTVFVMLGYGLPFSPADTRAVMIFDGSISNSANGGHSYATIVYGTGAAPAAGTLLSATTGVAVGIPVASSWQQANQIGAFSSTTIVAGLLATATYWLDVAQRAASGTCTLSDCELMAFSLMDPYSFPATPPGYPV